MFGEWLNDSVTRRPSVIHSSHLSITEPRPWLAGPFQLGACQGRVESHNLLPALMSSSPPEEVMGEGVMVLSNPHTRTARGLINMANMLRDP